MGVEREIKISEAGSTYTIPLLTDYFRETLTDFYVKDSKGDFVTFASNETTARFVAYSMMYKQIEADANHAQGGSYRKYYNARIDDAKELSEAAIDAAQSEFFWDSILGLGGIALGVGLAPFTGGASLVASAAGVAQLGFLAAEQKQEEWILDIKISQLEMAVQSLHKSYDQFVKFSQFYVNSEQTMAVTDAPIRVADLKTAFGAVQSWSLLADSGSSVIHQVDQKLIDEASLAEFTDWDTHYNATMATYGAASAFGQFFAPKLGGVAYQAGLNPLSKILVHYGLVNAWDDVAIKSAAHVGKYTKFAGPVASAIGVIASAGSAVMAGKALAAAGESEEDVERFLNEVLQQVSQFEGGFDPLQDLIPEIVEELQSAPDISASSNTDTTISDSIFSSFLGTATDSDWLSVVTDGITERLYSIQADDLFRPLIVLRDSFGRIVSEVEASIDGGSAQVEVPSVGDWFIEVKSANGKGGGYTVDSEPTETKVKVIGFEDNDYVDGDRGTNESISDGSLVNGVIDSSGDEDWYKIQLSENRTYEFKLQGVGVQTSGASSNVALDRPVIWVMDSSGDLVVGEISRRAYNDVELEFTPESSGTYYLNAKALPTGYHYGWGDNGYVRGSGKFTLSVESEALPAVLPDNVGDDENNARVVQPGDSFSEAIHDYRDDDYYVLNLEAGYSYRINIDEGSLNRPDVDIRHEDAGITADHDQVGDDSTIVASATQDGQLIFRVDWDSNQTWKTSKAGDYTVKVAEISTPFDEAAEGPSTTATVPVNGSVDGAIHFAGDVDWYRVDIDPANDANGSGYTSYSWYVNDNDGSNVDVDEGVIYDSQGIRMPGRENDSWTPEDQSPQTVWLEVYHRGSNGPDTGGYQLDLVAWKDDFGVTPSTAGLLSVGGSVSGSIQGVSRVEDADWFGMDLQANHLYAISSTGVDTSLRIETDLPGNDDLDESGGTYYFVPSVDGTFFLEVDEDGVFGNYSLSLTDLSASDDYAADVAGATQITPVSRTAYGQDTLIGDGLLERTGDHDWFKLDVEAGKYYRIDLDEDGNNDERLDSVWGVLRDGQGMKISDLEIDDASSGDNDFEFLAQTTQTLFLDMFAEPDRISVQEPGIGGYEINGSAYTTSGTITPDGASKTVQFTDQRPGEHYGTLDKYYLLPVEAGKVYDLTVNSTYPSRLDYGEVAIRSYNGDRLDGFDPYGDEQSVGGYSFRSFEDDIYVLEVDSQFRSELNNQTMQLSVSTDSDFDDVHNFKNDQNDVMFSNDSAAIQGAVEYVRNSAVGLTEDDTDWFGIDLQAGHEYAVTDNGGYGLLQLIDDSTGAILWSNVESGPYQSNSNRTAHFVVSKDEAGPTIGAYDFTIARSVNANNDPGANLAQDLFAGFETTGAIAITPAQGALVANSFEAPLDEDWFAISLAEDVTYQITADISGIRFSLRDANGAVSDFGAEDSFTFYSAYGESGYLVAEATEGVLGDYEIFGRAKDGFNVSPTVEVNKKVALQSGDQSAAFAIDTPYDIDDEPQQAQANSATNIGGYHSNAIVPSVLEIRIESLPEAGIVSLGANPLAVGQQIAIADLSNLSYAREDGQYGNVGALTYSVADPYGAVSTATVEFVVEAAAGDALPEDALFSVNYLGATDAASGNLKTLTIEVERLGFDAGDMDVSFAFAPASTIGAARSTNFVNSAAFSSGVLRFDRGDSTAQVEFDIDTALLSGAETQFAFVLTDIPLGTQAGINSLVLSADDILGTNGNTMLLGTNLNDGMRGSSQNEAFSGGDGLDVLDLSNATGALTLNLNLSSVSAPGLGTDSYTGIEGGIGGAGNDKFYGKADHVANWFVGGGGADLFSTFGGDDTVFGDAGNDRAFLGDGNDTAHGGDGADTLNGQDGDDLMTGGLGNDRLYGGAGNDDLTGGEGDDLLVGGAGADSLRAGAGNDRLFVDADDAPGGIDGGEGSDRLIGQGAAGLSFNLAGHNLEGALGTSGNDTFDGSALTTRTVIVGKDGDDTIIGGAGGDLLEGRNGQDTINGGAGADYLSGGNDADQMSGGADNDTLFGGAGDDLLLGGSGNDLLQGDAGNDALDGGDGDDDVRIDSADTQTNVSGGSGVDTLRLMGSDSFGFDLAAGGFERAFGNNGANALDGSMSTTGVTLYGLNGDDVLMGSAFGDSIIAGNDDDTVFVGAGADSAHGGNGSDTVVFAGNQADYNINIVNAGVSAKITDLATGDVNSLSYFEFAQFDDGVIAI